MATKRPAPLALAYKLRTARMITEYKGGHAEGLELLFVGLPDALERRKMLDRLEKAHVKMLMREAGPDLEQQDSAQVATLAVPPMPMRCTNPDCPVCTGEVAATRLVEPDECAANENGHRFGPHGPRGEQQCKWCGVAL